MLNNKRGQNDINNETSHTKYIFQIKLEGVWTNFVYLNHSPIYNPMLDLSSGKVRMGKSSD